MRSLSYLSVVALLSILLLAGCQTTTTEEPEVTDTTTEVTENTTDEMTDDVADDSEMDMTEDTETKADETDATEADLVTVDMTGENFKFFVNGVENPTLTVKKDDRVVINFTSTSGFHDVVIDEFNAATDQVDTGGTTSVEFVADQVGTFSYYCSVGQHRANGMEGMIEVTE